MINERGIDLLYSQAHHGEVVVGFGTITVLLDFGLQSLDDLLGGVEVSVAQDVEQAVVAELLLLRVLGFVESVGIDEERTALDGVDALALVLQAWPQADGCIGLHFEEVALMVATADDWGIMACIAVVEMTGLQVEQAEPEGDEHAVGVVVAREGVVHAGANLCRHHALLSQGEEQAGGLCHEERGRDTLAADVATVW